MGSYFSKSRNEINSKEIYPGHEEASIDSGGPISSINGIDSSINIWERCSPIHPMHGMIFTNF